jgi:two-component system, NtrC family, response regulator GlrR
MFNTPSPNDENLHQPANLVGVAPNFVRAIAQLPAIAKSEATVLIAGETGTGKELIARAVHYLGKRSMYPFVAVSCACLQPSLIEDELFGHERGAFTDAHARRVGLLAHAERGTVFLDEVDTLSPSAQAALLRVLQDKRYRPVGSNTELQADVRIVAATNARLDPTLQAGSFRVDLYYRLCVFTVTLPPLRERREDILILAEHFLRKHATSDSPVPSLSAVARDALLSYDWPGNVRELENAITRGIHYCHEGVIDAEDLCLRPDRPANTEIASVGVFKAAKRQALETFERAYLHRLMAEHKGNVSRAAHAAGKERRDLGRLLKKHQIAPRHFSTSKKFA